VGAADASMTRDTPAWRIMELKSNGNGAGHGP
jgi:hypothetical protein